MVQPEPPGQSSYSNNIDTTHPPPVDDQHPYDAYHTQQKQQPGGANQLTTTSPRSQSPDPMLQAAFAQMLQSPGQMQRLLAALASQSMNPMPEPPPPPGMQQPSQQLQHYGPPIDYSGGYNPDQFHQQYNPASSLPLPVISSPLHQSDELASYDRLAEDHNHLQKTYRDAAEIEEDVNALHSSLNSLIESLGLDPNVMDSSSHGQDAAHLQQQAVNPHDTVMSSGGLGGDTQDSSAQDFDFDQFLTDLSRHGDEHTDYTQFADKLDSSTRNDGSTPINDPSPEQLTAFLDEVQSTSDGTVSPVAGFRHDSPQSNTKRGSKRKSEVAGIPAEEHSTGRRMKLSSPGTKSKRKR
jgi:heat shock transcription factor